MKLSELICVLTKYATVYGDKDVIIELDAEGEFISHDDVLFFRPYGNKLHIRNYP